MDLHAHEKTPRMMVARADGACPFCITQLHEAAMVCCGCGAHKWYYRDIYLPTMAELWDSLFFAVIVVSVTYYAPSLWERVLVDLGRWLIVGVIAFFWIYLIVHLKGFIRAIRRPINGVVWRRKRWG